MAQQPTVAVFLMAMTLTEGGMVMHEVKLHVHTEEQRGNPTIERAMRQAVAVASARTSSLVAVDTDDVQVSDAGDEIVSLA